jgi:predicted RNA binding protein YcfA (HicA-like mRNA interferase family)
MPKLPGIRHKDAIRVLERLGWRVIHEGKHTIMGKGNAAVPIPRDNPIDAFTMGGIAKGAGLTPEEFRRLL